MRAIHVFVECIGWAVILWIVWALIHLPVAAFSFALCEFVAFWPHPDTRWSFVFILPPLWWKTLKRFWKHMPDEISCKAYVWRGPFDWKIKSDWWID